MGETTIGAAPAGQPGTPAAAPVTDQTAGQQAQPQVQYVTSEQLNASMDEIKRMIQSSTDKSYNRVQKMITSLQQAGIQNPTEAQARAMLEMQDRSEQQDQPAAEAQAPQNSAADPNAVAWIQANGGKTSEGYWFDIYDAAQEAGVGMITREDPEYAMYFEEDGKIKSFEKPRQFVRAFEQAFQAKKERLSKGQGGGMPNLASSPAMGSGGQKSSWSDPKTTSTIDLISAGLRQRR